MLFTIYTLFPDLIAPYLQEAILARAVREGLVKVELRDLRRFAGNRTGRVDDTPYGGGSGMVIRVTRSSPFSSSLRTCVGVIGEGKR